MSSRGLAPWMGMWVLLAGLPPAMAADTSLGDPTRPSHPGYFDAAAQFAEALRLTSIRVAPEARSAVINGVTLGEGDSIDGARVMRIRHGEVDLQLDGDLLTIPLVPVIKTRHGMPP